MNTSHSHVTVNRTYSTFLQSEKSTGNNTVQLSTSTATKLEAFLLHLKVALRKQPATTKAAS